MLVFELFDGFFDVFGFWVCHGCGWCFGLLFAAVGVVCGLLFGVVVAVFLEECVSSGMGGGTGSGVW